MSEGELEGVDYAFSRPDIGELARAGKRFAVRYGGPGTRDKWLDPDEARALTAAGLSIVANAEGSTAGLVGGRAVGAAWARSADSWFRSCGMPPDRPIYLSVDFDVNALQWPLVAQALRGAADEIGVERVGIYGGRRAITWARRDGVATWFWQTYAWSSGIWIAGNHIEQYLNGVQLAGADCDLNRAMQADFGQWTTGPTPPRRQTMLLIKIKGNDHPEVYRSDGRNYWHITSNDALQALLKAGHQIAEVADVAQLEDVAGKPAADVVGGVDPAALAKALAPLLPKAPTAQEVADVLAARLKD